MQEIIKFVGGSQPPRDTFEFKKTEDNIRLIQIRDYKSDEHIVYIPRSLSKRKCEADDVMIGRYGPPIFQILRGVSGSYNVALIKAEPKKGLTKSYLYYILKQRRLFELIEKLSKRSSGQTGIDMDALKNYPVLLPPEITQKRVSDTLDYIQNIDSIIGDCDSNARGILKLFPS